MLIQANAWVIADLTAEPEKGIKTILPHQIKKSPWSNLNQRLLS